MTAVSPAQDAVVSTLRPRFVAEVAGIDLSPPLGEAVVQSIRAAFREHPVLVFHDQAFDPDALMSFSGYFGTVAPHPQLKYRVPGYPGCSYVSNREPDGTMDEFGQAQRAVSFHSDGSFKPVPDAITILHGLEVPSVGGATEFADMYAAYDALAPELKVRIDGFRARHRLHRGVNGVMGPSPRSPEVLNHPGASHPVVRTHPESGRRSLYVNPVHTELVEGIPPEESRALLARLYEHCAQPQFGYTHRWRRGDVVMWDQRCTLHRAGGGAPRNEARVLLRTMIVTGEVPA